MDDGGSDIDLYGNTVFGRNGVITVLARCGYLRSIDGCNVRGFRRCRTILDRRCTVLDAEWTDASRLCSNPIGESDRSAQGRPYSKLPQAFHLFPPGPDSLVDYCSAFQLNRLSGGG